MRWLLEHLLRIQTDSAANSRWRLELLSLPRHDSALLAGAVALLGIFMVWLLYRREGKTIRTLTRYVLLSLRLIVLASVVFMLLEPVIVFTRVDHVPSNLLVLRDASESSDLRDAYADAAQADRLAAALNLSGKTKELRERTRRQLADRALEGGLLNKLGANGDRSVKVQDFAGRLLAATTQPTTQSTEDRSATAIGAAILQAISANQGQPISGILLVTDGQSNNGESPTKAAEYAAAEGVPVVSIALGTSEGPRNAKIDKIEVSPVVFVRDPSPVRVLVESRGLKDQPAALVLERNHDGGPWEEIGRQPITLEESGRQQTIPFTFKEDRPARLELRARLEDVGPELSTDDNVGLADVRAIRQKIRVLFIAGETFPEVEFIRNALLRDNTISASTWLQTADPDYEQPGDPRIKRLPASAEELNEFDCIVMYDPDPAQWPSDFPQLVNDFVAKSGGGLIYVAGERNTKDLFDHPDDPASAWLSLLPVVVEPGLYHTDVSVKLSSREAWKLDVTPEGRVDPIFSFAEKPEQNEAIIANLPGMFWHFPVTRGKPGATVLARHGDARMRNEHGAHVLLATQLVGPGRTFFVGFDSTYRWRYLDEHYFDGFWARIIDRAGRSKQLGGRYPYSLAVDRSGYRPGSQVTLTARFENVADRDTGVDALHGEVEVGTQPPVPITLSPKSDDRTVFETTFTVDKPGTHSVRVWTGEPDALSHGNVRAATLQIPVEAPNAELDQPVQDLATLQSVARITGGAVFDLASAQNAADAFKIRRVARTIEERQEVWDAPIIFCVMLAALFVEWVVRKKVRLI